MCGYMLILILPHLLLTLLITLPVYYTGNIVELREGWQVKREGVLFGSRRHKEENKEG